MLAALALAPLAMLLVHALLARLARRASRQVVATTAGLGGAAATALAWNGLAAPADATVWAQLYVAVVSVLIAYAYFHFFNMSETARRVRILMEVAEAGTLDADAIAARHPPAPLVEVRIERLLAAGQAVEREGRIALASSLLVLAARVVFAWRRVLGFGDGPKEDA